MGGNATRKVGLLGGSFNPVHFGHLILAQDALEAFALDEVWFIPCARPAHKPHYALAAEKHRWAMLERAMAGHPAFALSRVELARDGISYTIDTLTALRAEHPDTEWFFIIGADSLTELASWKAIGELLKLCRFITMRRPGLPDREQLKERIALPAPWPERLVADCFDGHLIDISSSDIRKRVAEGRSIRYLVPPDVEIYIRDQHVYA